MAKGQLRIVRVNPNSGLIGQFKTGRGAVKSPDMMTQGVQYAKAHPVKAGAVVVGTGLGVVALGGVVKGAAQISWAGVKAAGRLVGIGRKAKPAAAQAQPQPQRPPRARGATPDHRSARAAGQRFRDSDGTTGVVIETDLETPEEKAAREAAKAAEEGRKTNLG